MDCPSCKSRHHVKDGIVRGKQRYKCKDCRYRYTVERRSTVKLPEIRRLALELYIEGLSFRSIGKVLKISYGTVYVWVKEWNAQISLPRNPIPVKKVNLDQMLTCVASANQTPNEYGLLLIDLKNKTSVLSVSLK